VTPDPDGPARLRARHPALAGPARRYAAAWRRRFCDRMLAEVGASDFGTRLGNELRAEAAAREVEALLADAGLPPEAVERYLAAVEAAATAEQAAIWRAIRLAVAGEAT
jgi:hypothetical protein